MQTSYQEIYICMVISAHRHTTCIHGSHLPLITIATQFAIIDRDDGPYFVVHIAKLPSSDVSQTWLRVRLGLVLKI